MANGRPRNDIGCVSYLKSRNRYVAQYYIYDNETQIEKRAQKYFLTEVEA